MTPKEFARLGDEYVFELKVTSPSSQETILSFSIPRETMVGQKLLNQGIKPVVEQALERAFQVMEKS